MNRLLPPGQSGEPLEDRVDMTCVPAEVERRVEVDALGNLLVRAYELAEVLLLLLRPQRPAPTGASASRWVKKSPWPESGLRSIRSGRTSSPSTSQAKRSSM